MTIAVTTRVNRWLVCETEDRWYRAVCRYIPEIIRNDTILRIERVSIEASQTISSRGRMANEHVVVLWELPDVLGRPADFLTRLELISSIRLESPNVLQVASSPSPAMVEAALSAQEAGIAFFLRGLWSLPNVGKAVTRHFSPLG